MPADKPTCSNCHNCVAVLDEFECRASWPTWCLDSHDEVMSGWPPTEAGEWCAMHLPKDPFRYVVKAFKRAGIWTEMAGDELACIRGNQEIRIKRPGPDRLFMMVAQTTPMGDFHALPSKVMLSADPEWLVAVARDWFDYRNWPEDR